MEIPGKYSIVLYQREHYDSFRNMGYAWLNEYGLLEDEDAATLDDPEGHILANGGRIYMLLCDGKPCGTASLMRAGEGEYELAKLSVAAEHRGKGLGRMLTEHCINEARSLGAERLILYTNSLLKSAQRIYGEVGFTDVPCECDKYELVDRRMELLLYKRP